VIDDARSHFEFCLCDRVGYRRGGMALVSVRLCRLDIQALIHMGDAADRFRGDWRDGLSTRILWTKRPRRASLQSQIETDGEAVSCACGARLSRLSDAWSPRRCAGGEKERQFQAWWSHEGSQ
jgi:hypothetical protein